ncbi:hypothetical protein SEA_JONJAMES_192 [Gordonia Phage JonJames]|nr:hypothetical protein SEA_JONJAMES_192 [Gordonia Phage JonJames]
MATITITHEDTFRQYEGVARYDHDVIVVPGTYELLDVNPDGAGTARARALIDAHRADNGEPTQFWLTIYNYDLEAFAARTEHVINLDD